MSKNNRFQLIRSPLKLPRERSKPNLLPKALALAVASCFAADLALANPYGMSVVNGQVTFNRNGNTLTLTNTPGSIINWQSFSISANEVTRFIQQSAASSVLNKVIGANPSLILGALQSNGRVFLINPNGILFGAGAQIDVGGLVASTLNLSNADFLAGRMRFTETPGAGSLVNNGAITTPTGGQVYLIAPNVQNTGIISSPQGQVILAAGRSVELVDAATPNLRVEISAPDTEAVNVGQIIANSGKIGIYSGLIRNSGVVRADGVVQGANGEILLKATNNVALEPGGVLSASGAGNGIGGGVISVAAPAITNAGQVLANAADNASAGNISVIAQDMLTLEGTSRVAATGADVNSSGGIIFLYSYGDATAKGGQVIDLSGGSTSGDGGSGEFSAARFAAFSGSILGSAAPGYQGGNFIFDPVDGTIGPAVIGANTTSFAANNITVTGNVTVNSGFSLTLLADHRSGTPGDWDDGVEVGAIVGVGAILNPGGFVITATDATNSLTMMAAGGGIGTLAQPVRTNMNGGSLSVFTNNPAQVGLADTFVTNAGSVVNIAGFDDGLNSNSFRIESIGNITQSGIITADRLAAVVSGSNNTVNLPMPNEVGTVAGSASGGAFSAAFSFNNAQPLAIGTVSGVSGISVDGQTAAVINVTTSLGDLTVSNPVVATSVEGVSLITLASVAGANTVNAAVTANGNSNATVTLTSGTSMAINAPVTANAANGDATALLTSGTTMAINAAVSATADENATVALTSGTTMAVSAAVTADGGEGATATLTSGSSMLLNGAVSATSDVGDVTITATSGTSMTVNAAVNADGAEGTATLTMTSGTTMAVNAPVSADGGEGATATLISGSSMLLGGAVSATSEFADATFTATSSSGGITINNTVDTNTFFTGGNATLLITANGGGAINMNSTVTADANLDALVALVTNGGGAINLTGEDTVNAFGNNATINLTTNGGGAINVNSPINAEANLANATINVVSSGALTVGSDVSADASFGDASVTLTSGTSMIVNGEVTANADNNNATITLTSGTSMVVTGEVTANGNNNATITLTSGTSMAVNAALSADGAEGATVTLTSGSGGLTINNTIEAFSDGSNATLLITANGGGAINMNSTISADGNLDSLVELVTNGGGAINLNAAETIIAFGNNATVNVTANGGAAINVNTPIIAEADFNAAVNLTGGSIVLGNNVTADGGEGATISVSALSGAITRTGGVLSALGSGDFSEINLSATNGIGNIGSPIQIEFGVDPFIEANNTTSGNIVLSQAAGTLLANSITNTAPGGAVDLTAAGGNLDAVSVSSAGALTLRSTVAEGIVNVTELAAVTATGIVTLIADNMDIQGLVSSGANVVNVRTFTAARPIFLSSDAVGGALELSQAEINFLNGGNGIVVGEQVARNNPITFKNPTTIAGAMSLFGSSVTQEAGATIAGGLLVGVGAGDVALTEAANAINRFSASGAVSGNVNLVTTSNIALGLVQATGAVNVTSGGAITDGNPAGADVIASSVALTAANGIGTLADPLETQVNSPLSLTSTGGDIGVINVGNVNLALSLTGGGNAAVSNIGNLVLDTLAFSGVAAVVEASGLMSLGSNIGVSASDGLALIGDSGLSVERSISVTGGDLILSGGLSNLAIAAPSGGLSISARNVDLIAGNISVIGVDGGDSGLTSLLAAQNMALAASNQVNIRGGAVNSSPVEIRNLSGGFSVIAGGDVNLLGGAGANSHALFFGNPDVDMQIGGVIRLDSGSGAGSFSKVEAASAATVNLLFPNCAEGCFFVNGVEGVVFDAASGTGFVAGGAPAILNLAYGIATPEQVTEVTGSVQATLNSITGEINESVESKFGGEREEDQTAKKEETTTGPGVCS